MRMHSLQAGAVGHIRLIASALLAGVSLLAACSQRETTSPNLESSVAATTIRGSETTPPVTSPPVSSTVQSSSRAADNSALQPEELLSPVAVAGHEPKVRYPKNLPAVGAGANAKVTSISNAMWRRMVGYSWTPGCPTGIRSLRAVAVNYWGFDGRRYRGNVVVHADVASKTAAAFTELYERKFRIRQMKIMDSSWGHNDPRPGADDHASVLADNTSAFNCRYATGSRSTWSRHSYGKAIDINPYENPYVSGSYVSPDRYFHRNRTGFGVITPAIVRIFTSRGFSWGGAWPDPDYQHMEIR